MMSMRSHAYGRTWLYHAWQRSTLLCLLFIIGGWAHLSCSKKPAAFQPTDPLGIANKWVYDSMQLYYYWADQMPRNPDYSLPTQGFFKTLLSPEDRFSYLNNRSGIIAPKTTVELFGFQYALINHPFDAQKLVGVVTVVVPGSYADSRTHLKRGYFFTRVNDREITSGNMSTIVDDLRSTTNSAVMLQLAAFNNNGTALTDSVRVAVMSANVAQKSIYATKVFQKNNVKTGYLAYYFCLEKDDAVVLDKMQALKNAGINELILDLRYNPGGSVASASKLAATLVSSFNAANTFITYKGNRHGGTVKLSFKDAILFSANSAGKDMNYLQSINAGLKRIFILTSAATASAAELLAHNLEPYVSVKLIGDKTFGKDEASFTIEDTRNPKQVEWVLNPIVYKVADANGNGNYSSGLTPDYTVNEFSKLPLQDLGVNGDLPVDKALELIYGTSQVDGTPLRTAVFSFPKVRPLFYSSQTGDYRIAAP